MLNYSNNNERSTATGSLHRRVTPSLSILFFFRRGWQIRGPRFTCENAPRRRKEWSSLAHPESAGQPQPLRPLKRVAAAAPASLRPKAGVDVQASTPCRVRVRALSQYSPRAASESKQLQPSGAERRRAAFHRPRLYARSSIPRRNRLTPG